MQFYNIAPIDVPADEYEIGLEMKERSIPGGDGQDMLLYIYEPKIRGAGPLPCVVYSHGGGMTFIPTMNRIDDRWCRSLAASGLVVVMVDFRNAWTKTGYNHFPAGLNDCAAAVQWVHSQREALNISTIVLQGESGGGNLAASTALKAKKEGWVSKIDGVFASIPYISNAYGWTDEQKLKFLPSLVECNGYFINMHCKSFLPVGASRYGFALRSGRSGEGEQADEALKPDHQTDALRRRGLPSLLLHPQIRRSDQPTRLALPRHDHRSGGSPTSHAGHGRAGPAA